jgi:tRNA(fMet)-specific endonuclease VapC
LTRFGELLAELARRGTPIGIEEARTGATALVHGLVLVSFNLEHFQHIPGLQVTNWKAEAPVA